MRQSSRKPNIVLFSVFIALAALIAISPLAVDFYNDATKGAPAQQTSITLPDDTPAAAPDNGTEDTPVGEIQTREVQPDDSSL